MTLIVRWRCPNCRRWSTTRTHPGRHMVWRANRIRHCPGRYEAVEPPEELEVRL